MKRPLRLWSRRWARRLARLNHILIPATAAERDRLRTRPWVKTFGAAASVLFGFSREGRTLWLLSFPIGLAGLDVRLSQVHLLFTLLTGLLVGSWLLRPLFRIPTAALLTRVYSPARVAAGSPVHFQIELSNQGNTTLTNLQLTLPFLPWDGRWVNAAGGVATLEPGTRTVLSACATFEARGEHHLDLFRVGQLVPFGLAHGRLVGTMGARFLVVPRPAHVVSVEAPAARPLGHGTRARSPRAGESDFAGVRPYRFGDQLKHLHARTWARTGEPHVRELVDEQDVRKGVLLLLETDPNDEARGEAVLSLAAGIAARLALHGDGIDTLVCDGERFEFARGTGPLALDRVLDHLSTHKLGGMNGPSPEKTERLLREAATAVFITAGDPVAHAPMVERLTSYDAPLLWLVVVDQNGDEANFEQVPKNSHFVAIDLIESGAPLSL